MFLFHRQFLYYIYGWQEVLSRASVDASGGKAAAMGQQSIQRMAARMLYPGLMLEIREEEADSLEEWYVNWAIDHASAEKAGGMCGT